MVDITLRRNGHSLVVSKDRAYYLVVDVVTIPFTEVVVARDLIEYSELFDRGNFVALIKDVEGLLSLSIEEFSELTDLGADEYQRYLKIFREIS